MFGDRLHIVVQDAKKMKSSIVAAVEDEKIDVLSYRVVPASLEDVFIASIHS
jgi:hypothetical protein